MQEKSLGFLEYLYRGAYRSELLGPDPASIDEEKVGGLIAKLEESLSDFDGRAAEAGGRIPEALLGRLKEIGVFGMIVPREYGGLGFTISEYLRFIERMAGMDMALSLVPLAHLSIGVKGLLLFGSEDQKRRYLPGAASGETIFSFALTEPAIGSDAQNIRTTARKSEDGTSYLLNGTKTYITNANYAGAFTVFAQLDAERPGTIGAFVVERDWKGVTVGKDMPKMGLHVSSTAAVRMKEVEVPAENLIGGPGDGFKIAMTILNYGRLGLGAASAGLMQQSLEEMVARSLSRKQFGVPILEFELIQQKVVEARVHAYAARAMTYFTASLLDRAPLSNVALESSHAKLYGTTRCWDTLYEAMQVAGGSGYLSTLPYEKRMRDFRVTTIFEGTTEIHSIYPALSLFRSYGRELQRRGAVGKWFLLLGMGWRTVLTRMKESHPALRRARATAIRGEQLFRAMLRKGFLRFGSKIVGEEFYLRRMTHLSLSLFWLIASISYLRSRHPNGDFPREELDVIEYLTAEADTLQRAEGRSRRSRVEELTATIVASLSAKRA